MTTDTDIMKQLQTVLDKAKETLIDAQLALDPDTWDAGKARRLTDAVIELLAEVSASMGEWIGGQSHE